jgi:RNA polymerase sigma-70 factor (family 1)
MGGIFEFGLNLQTHTISDHVLQTNPDFQEEELLALLVASNRPAFKQLYVAYYRKIYAYALKFTKSTFLAEDITQDVFLKIWENRESLKDVKFFKGYLFTICKNRVLTMLSRAAHEVKIKDLIVAGTAHFHSDTEFKIQNEEYERLLNQAIESLPPQRKLIFKLCKIEGKCYDEVATQLGISAGTVNDHIVKATRAIREYLKRYNISLMHLFLFCFFK